MPLNLPKLRELLTDKRHKAVAEAAGITPQHLSLIVNGRFGNVTIGTLDALALALGVKATDLLQ